MWRQRGAMAVDRRNTPGLDLLRRVVNMFMLRFDMRAPTTGAPPQELYQAALEMTCWSESRGVLTVVLSEHHVTGDGYLPSPLLMASALAARTTTVPITVAIVILPLYQTIRLAEEMIILDLMSGGRVGYVAAIGYRPEEYELYGIEFGQRGKIADEQLPILLAAKSGEPFEYRGQMVQLMPAPLTPGGPRIAWGGGSVPAAKRAGRFGLDFFAQTNHPSLEEAYRAAARAHGHEPGMCMLPSPDTTTTLFVADNVDQAWEELGPYLMHDVLSYASINAKDTRTASISFAETADELRAENRSHRIVNVDEAVSMIRSGDILQLQPLVGGLPPEIAWPYLRRVTDEVMPSLND